MESHDSIWSRNDSLDPLHRKTLNESKITCQIDLLSVPENRDKVLEQSTVCQTCRNVT